MKLVRESIEFTRGKDPKKAMDIGLGVENRDPNKRLENFRAAFPEVSLAFNASIATHAPGKHPIWQTISLEAKNPKDDLTLDEREEKMLDCLKTYTDFDIVETESSFDRRYMPGLVRDPKEVYEQHYTFRMRNEEDIR